MGITHYLGKKENGDKMKPICKAEAGAFWWYNEVASFAGIVYSRKGCCRRKKHYKALCKKARRRFLKNEENN